MLLSDLYVLIEHRFVSHRLEKRDRKKGGSGGMGATEKQKNVLS